MPAKNIVSKEHDIDERLDIERRRQLPVYVGDIERMMDTVASQVPIATSDVIYDLEVSNQEKIYLALCGIGTLALILGVML